MARTSKTCIFCGNSPTTREHIWADWLKRYIPKNLPNYTSGFTIWDEGAKQTKTTGTRWGGDPRSRRLQIVCASCNEGWMHDLQDAVKPILVPLLRGEKAGLTRGAQNTLATWSAMTTICAEYFDPKSAGIPLVDRRWLFTRQSPPDTFRMWIGNYKRHKWKVHWSHHSIRITEHQESNGWGRQPDGTARPNTQMSTFVAGQFYLHVFVCPFPEILNGFQLAPRARSLLAPIWPVRESLVMWPPRVMTDLDADRIAASIFHGLDAIGRQFGT
jgi:hypothetical protein